VTHSTSHRLNYSASTRTFPHATMEELRHSSCCCHPSISGMIPYHRSSLSIVRHNQHIPLAHKHAAAAVDDDELLNFSRIERQRKHTHTKARLSGASSLAGLFSSVCSGEWSATTRHESNRNEVVNSAAAAVVCLGIN
jgi:hypothetical protein